MTILADSREAIMARLEALALTVAPHDIWKVVRNDLSLTDDMLPALAILEGDETPTAQSPRRRRRLESVIMTMTPEICIIAGEKASILGPKLNELRSALIKAVEQDEELQTTCGPNGGAAYIEMLSDLGLGRHMLGRMSLKFSIVYPLFPSRL